MTRCCGTFAWDRAEEWSIGLGRRKVHMWLVFPPGFNPRKKYPLLAFDPRRATRLRRTRGLPLDNHVFAAQGYIVAGVNFHGSSSFGQEFIESSGIIRQRDWRTSRRPPAVSKRRYVDRKRVFAVGQLRRLLVAG